MTVTFSDFLDSLNPKQRAEFMTGVVTDCEVTKMAVSKWKKRNSVPKYARPIILKYAPVDVEFIWDIKEKEAA